MLLAINAERQPGGKVGETVNYTKKIKLLKKIMLLDFSSLFHQISTR